MKKTILTITGITGGIIVSALGGWTVALQTLVIFIIIDYCTGFMLAAVFQKSAKTEHGALESKAGFKGLCKKGVILLIVLVANRLDKVANSAFIKDAVTIALITNETISIIENAGLMGVPIPAPIVKAVEILNKKGDIYDNH